MRRSISVCFPGEVMAVAVALCPATAWAQTTSDWYVYANARAAAYGTGGNNPQVASECNGPSRTCSPAAGHIGEHSDSLPRASSAVGASNTYPIFGTPTNPLGTSFGQAIARADLSTGEIGITTIATGPRSELTYGSAQASLFDRLHFINTTGISGLIPIIVSVRVDGGFEGFVQPRFGFIISGASDTLSTGTFGWFDGNPTGPVTTKDAGVHDFGKGWGSWSVYGPDRFVGTFMLDPLRPDVSIGMSLSAGGSTAYGDTFANFAHTAAISFDLPAGLSFTSDSGVFLTAADAGAVPEPTTWAMMIVGLGAIGAALRHRRRTVVRFA